MLFTTDQQTIEDLNIFGKHSATSVYALFNNTSTRGGAALLEEMFSFPLSNADAINKRSGIIRYFSNNRDFPFETELFDIAEQYLANSDERTKLPPAGNTVVKKISGLLAEDGNYKFIYGGVNAFITLVHTMRGFIATLLPPDNTNYQTEAAAIRTLLAEPVFRNLPKEKNRQPYTIVAELDVLFRFRHREQLRRLLRFIYQIDVYISVARVATARGFTFPKAVCGDMHLLDLQGLYHPHLTGAVPNDLRLTSGENVVFLTGANMAGKSTFMKSLGIAMYLAHMGFPVAAKQMEFSVMDGIYTTINLPDNLGMGASHFYAEVLRVKKVAKELSIGKNLFVVADELFRGTNVKDAYEATIAITSAFAWKRNSIFIISTHIIEAGEVLRRECESIRFCYLPTRLEENTAVYTYTLAEGITDDRHGMIIINNEGIIELLKKGQIT